MRFLVILFCAASLLMVANCSDHRTALEKLNLEEYQGKPVSSLLKAAGRPYLRRTFITEPPGFLSGCMYVYDENLTLLVYISGERSTKYKVFNENFMWDYSGFEDEIILCSRISDLRKVRQRIKELQSKQ